MLQLSIYTYFMDALSLIKVFFIEGHHLASSFLELSCWFSLCSVLPLGTTLSNIARRANSESLGLKYLFCIFWWRCHRSFKHTYYTHKNSKLRQNMGKSKRIRRNTKGPINGKSSSWTYVQFDPTDKWVYT